MFGGTAGNVFSLLSYASFTLIFSNYGAIFPHIFRQRDQCGTTVLLNLCLLCPALFI